ncbi:hypothetical protein OG21DRAFT_398937 [Imleria badia]|nr:hypothetical protein OG21DRAFT_398937 [Imleria badia]
MPTMVPPSTPERPRISPYHSGSAVPLSSCTRGKSTPCVGRVIVDMLPNQLFIPQCKSTPAATTKAVLSTPPPTVQPSRDLNVPFVQLPSSAETPFPRLVVVNPTPHPTPPTTPILHDDTPGAPQPLSTFLLPPLPPPALRSTVPSTQVAPQQSQPRHALTPKEPSSSHPPTRIVDAGSLARQSDRRFFLQQSPEDVSSERGDGSTASGKSPSDLFAASSVTSSQMKSVLTDMNVDDDSKDDHEEEEQGEDDDRRSTTAAAAARHTYGRQNKPKRGKEVGKRPPVKRSQSAKHVAPSMVKKLSGQQHQHPQPEHAEKKDAMFNIGSGSSNGSRSANGSTGKGHPKSPSVVNGFTAIQPSKVSPLQAHPPVIPKRLSDHVTPGNVVLNGNASTNGTVKVNATANVNGNVNANAQSRKTIVVANMSSEEYETTDGEDSEAWASEEMDAEDKSQEAEETRLREAALEAQRQRDLFAKVPKRSYSNLNRTQSGLLSQLMNPNPTIFPPNHPYRVSRSSADISRQYQLPQQRTPVPQRSSSAYAPPRLSTSKSAAALPMAAQINAISSSKPPSSSALKWQESEKNGYRPKGPPKEQEMEDDSGDDADDKIQISQSVAQQKLQALMSRRSSDRGTSSHLIQAVAMEVGPGLLSSTTAPIPLGHPYHLPAAAPPMTPRTTRRRMLKTELSESMRRQLLWERQVSSNTNPALVARRATQGLSGLRPTTSTSSDGINDTSTRTEAQDRDERRRRAMARNRSWTDDYHYAGW